MRRSTFIHRGDDGPEEISIELNGSSCRFSRGVAIDHAEAVPLPDGRLSLLFTDGRQICGRVFSSAPGQIEVFTRASRRRIALAEPLRDRIAHSADHGLGLDEDEEIRAQMPGRVVEVSVARGDRVEAGALLLVLEAMKMQNEIRTSRGGTVLRVEAEAGTTVEGGSLLAVLGAGDAKG